MRQFYNICSLERLLCDFPSDFAQNELALLDEVRKMATTSFANENLSDSQQKSNLDRRSDKKLAEKSKMTINYAKISSLLEKAASKIISAKPCEGFAHFGLFPEDFAINISAHYIDSHGLVVGIRTAGSYLAPAFASVNDLDYITIRPAVGKITNTDALNLAKSTRIYLVDEGPGTGMTFNLAISEIRKFTTAEIILVHNRSLPNSFKSIPSVKVEANTAKLYIDNIATGLGIPHRTILHDKLSLFGYESPKETDGKSTVFKFIGAGPIAQARIQILEKLALFVPKIFAFDSGIVAMDYVSDLNTHPAQHIQDIATYLNAWSELNRVSSISTDDLIGIYDKILQVGHISLLTKLLDKSKVQIHQIIRPDWRLERSKWILAEKCFKLDTFHYNDYADSPLATPSIMSAGTILELGLNRYQTSELYRKLDPELFPNNQNYLLAHSLIYADWKDYFYRYIIDNLSSRAVSISSVRNYYLLNQKRIKTLKKRIFSL